MQSADQPRASPRERAGWLGAWAAAVALAAWTDRLAPGWLIAAAAGVVLWTWFAVRPRTWWNVAVLAVLWLAVGTAAGVQLRLNRIATEWPEVRHAVEERSADALRQSLDDLVDRGDQAVSGAAGVASADGVVRASDFAQLESLRSRTGVSALAVYTPEGVPAVWAGEHRGSVPDAVARGDREYLFHEGPLFSYLYFTSELANGRTAVAAVLLKASAGVPDGNTPFVERFARRHGIAPRFTTPERASGEGVWDWSTDRPILSVSFAALTQERWRERITARGRWATAGVLGLVSVLLLAGWYRRRVGGPVLPAAMITLAAFLIPWGALTDSGGLFSPLRFLLPLPGDVSLGESLILLVGSAVAILARNPGGAFAARIPLAVRVGIAAVAMPMGLLLIRDATAGGSLAGRTAGGVSLQLATALLLGLALFLLLPRPGGSRPSRWAGRFWGLAILLSAAMGLALVAVWEPTRALPMWPAAAWALPFALFAAALARSRSAWGTLRAWLAAGWLAGTLAIPWLWTVQTDARLAHAETELAHLGTEADPFLDFLLRQFADRVLFLAAEGEDGVNLLYRSWVSSGLAKEGYEARITTWAADVPSAELQLSDLELPPQMVPEMLAAARAADEPILERYTQLESVHYLLMVQLPGGRVVSVAVPPRRRLGRATALARFLDSGQAAPDDGDYESLSLIPVASSSARGDHAPADSAEGQVSWVRTRAGFRSEARVDFPAGPMHAHLVLRTPSWPLLLARALLVQIFILTVLAILWGAARTLCGELFGFPAARWRWIRSFRGRLTLALVTFFLVPTLAFGAVAYGGLSREVERTAAALARWRLERAAPLALTNRLEEAGSAVGADLLLYRRGTLVDAAAPEVLDLGLFQSWLPPRVFLLLASGEELEAREEQRLAANEYLVAYRRLRPSEVLSAPTPLASGEIARQQREIADVVLLISLLGAALAAVLSLLVGRALTQPIDKLSRAAAAVGGGNLRVRLPEGRHDEFGGLYRSFNRMVRRLRRARASEVRSARVLAWGEMARQVAHEIKNPLTPIKLSVQHLRRAHADRRPDFGDILDRNVDAVLREIDRLGEIARAFARFGSPAEAAADLEQVDVQAIVDEVLALYRAGSDGIVYRAETAPGVPPVQARGGELKEVLVNLLENAREALDGGGEIYISAAPAGGGDWVRLDVRDTGKGISPESLPRIFEPQFSTRTSGTGLGLAIVRRLVESWGGEITAESAQGAGTTLHLRLRAFDGSRPEITS